MARLAALLADLEEHTADLDVSALAASGAAEAPHGYHTQQRRSTRRPA